MNLPRYEMTERVKQLRAELYKRGFSDRSGEWVKQEDLKDITEDHSKEPVMKRRAYAIKEMLEALTSSKINEYAHTYEIGRDELIVGVLPMGSNGLGKIFPNYMTEDEKRVSTISNRTELSLLGHNTINYERLLNGGIRAILEDCDKCLKQIGRATSQDKKSKKTFYESVKISLNAVVDYAKSYAELAAKQAAAEKDENRRKELLEIERICRKVPMEKPDTFHEALQSIYFVHVALHSCLNLMSLGRLDQVLDKYLKDTVVVGQRDEEKAIELFECFIIKGAGRLNLTTEYLLQQDHMDYNAALGTHPYYLDQKAGVNNFLQNIIIGGKTPDGEEAVNPCSYVILQAFENVNLSTPGIYVRMGQSTPQPFKDAVARTLNVTKNLPAILNDDVLISAMHDALVENEVLARNTIDKFQRLANDYCVDGCWEPVLNGVSDWTFCMINGMTILECALNKGATLDSNPNMLRGGKLSFSSGEITSYEKLLESLAGHIQFFVDQSSMSMYMYYMMDEYINPCPLLSAFFGTCMERGRDKAWGGAEYNLGGTVLTGVPNMVNTICAIKKWVFDKEEYQFSQVTEAMRNDFTCEMDPSIDKLYKEMHERFRKDSPKFGDNDEDTTAVAAMIMKNLYDSVMSAKKLSDKVFLKKPANKWEEAEVKKLRSIAGYYGKSLREILGPDFNIRFTAGSGTFEQYPLQGTGVAADADRDRGKPLAPNFSPMPGTIHNTISHVMASMKTLGLDKMAAGVMTDLVLEDKYNKPEIINELLAQFIENGGSMLTLAINNSEKFKEIYNISYKAENDPNPEERQKARKELEQYADLIVRVGGWQAPFISMSLEQQKNYIDRPLSFE